MAIIQALRTCLPKYQFTQRQILEYLSEYEPLGEANLRMLRSAFEGSAIDTRYSVLPDFGMPDANSTLFGGGRFPLVEERLGIFVQEATALAYKAIDSVLESAGQVLDKITHVLTISCTGMTSPGLETMILRHYDLPPTTQRLAVNFMGCHAGFHGLKVANAICESDPEACVLMVDVELCTLHFSPNISRDAISANTLFADGCAAMIISKEPVVDGVGLSMNHFGTRLSRQDREKDMAWTITSRGFLMKLSSYVPQLVSEHLTDFLAGVDDITSVDHWAIHPGGRRILDAIEKFETFGQKAVATSSEVLRQFGNMSSASVFFVLDKIMSQQQPESGKRVQAIGFGPGITMETCSMTVA